MSDIHHRVLIFAATHRDAESTSYLLMKAGIVGTPCTSVEDLSAKIKEGAGALILAKEVLTASVRVQLSAVLDHQPTWSHLPTILLISAGDLSLQNSQTLNLLQLRNTTLLERPVRVNTLVSVVQGLLADRKRQYEVRDLLLALSQAKQAADAANHAKSSFLANMSHEIRTPLGSILGFSELMLEPEISNREKAVFVQTIKRNGQQLSALIDDILDLSKIESGHVRVENLDVNIGDLIAEVKATLRPTADRKGLKLRSHMTPDVPMEMRTDPVRMRQILMNIVGNAIKFTDRGQITIETSILPPLRRSSPKRLRIAVTDMGIGITPEQAQKLFQPFSQADASITRRFGGTGLGLKLSKELAKLLNGDLQLLRSEIGVGSTFIVDLELHEVFSPELTAVPSPNMAAREAGLRLKNRRILLVDDSKDNQSLISTILSLEGAEVKTANDGLEGIDMALASPFDVVLMDVQMPRLGGREATAELRGRGYAQPVIALTAHALREDRERCLAAGCNGYLTKPVQRRELIQTVASYLK